MAIRRSNPAHSALVWRSVRRWLPLPPPKPNSRFCCPTTLDSAKSFERKTRFGRCMSSLRSMHRSGPLRPGPCRYPSAHTFSSSLCVPVLPPTHATRSGHAPVHKVLPRRCVGSNAEAGESGAGRQPTHVFGHLSITRTAALTLHNSFAPLFFASHTSKRPFDLPVSPPPLSLPAAPAEQISSCRSSQQLVRG